MESRFAILALLILAIAGLIIAPAAAATTEVTITKLADDGTSVIDQRTVNATWMEDNLPVLGDGVTVYYHQGPTFDENDPWNDAETKNLRDMGAVQGTDVKDLCELVGGMDPGETVAIRASDGLTKEFPYEYIYTPDDRQGPMGIAWVKDGTYVPSYSEGMRLIFFAETTNASGYHVFGNWDMHEAWAPQYWYNYSGTWPSSGGNSVQYVNRIIIKSNDPAPADWSISLNGSTDRTLTRSEFIGIAAAHPASFYHNKYGLLEGTNLSAVVGLVDDDDPLTMNPTLAAENYTITVYGKKKGVDYVSTFYSTELAAGEKTYVLGNRFDGIEINQTTLIDRVFFPLYLQGTGVDTTQRAVEQISRIELTFSGSGADVIFEGEVTLPDENVTVTSSQGTDYSIPARTPLGALDTVAGAQGFSYAVTDKKWADSGILMLDDIGAYPYVKGGNSWVCYVNGVALDDYGSPATDGLNVRALADGDHVNFYYGPKGVTAETAEAVVSITVDIGSGADVFFEGDVVLPDENVTVTSSQGTDYSIPVRTPLGALDTVSKAGNFTYAVTDKKWADSGILMVDDIGAYPFVKGQKAWVCYVNGVLLDDYAYPATDGLNVRALAEGDKVNYYYGPKGATTPENAEAAILLTARLSNADILFSGEVVLDEGNVTVTSSQGTDYSIPARTPLGALDTVAGAQGFSYAVTDKKWADSGILMLDDIGAYPYVKGGNSWVCYVNGVALDDYGSPATDGLNVRALVAGDQVNFYYGPKGVTAETAEAAVLITVRTGSSPGDWTLSMIGAQTVTVTSDYFESGIACGHNASWTDPETGDVWAGMPLWFLVGMVDDIESGSHYTFNDAFAAEGYSVKVTSKDGYSINIPSADMARNSGFIVANTLNGSALPETIGEKSKPCWPLQIKGADASAGQLVGAIASIELVGLPEPSDGWTLRVCGVVNDTITQAEFEELGCHGGVTYTDEQGIVWSGVPLWYLVGVSDNIETTTHWTFDDDAAAANYTIRVAASDGYSQSYGSAQVARSNGYILANLMDGQPIPETDSSYPIKLVGDNVPKKVKGVAEIDLVDLIPPPPAEGSWNLALKGPIDYTCTQDFFELAYSCSHHKLSWTDPVTGERWTGIGLWELVGWVDDRVPHGANGFNDVLADTGYTVIVTASDGYSKEFSSKDIARNNNYIVANKLNGSELSKEGNKPSWPLRLVGADVSTHASVGGIASIELTEFQKPVDVPTVHIVKFAADGTTIVNETTIDYLWMQQNLQVYGDDQPYKFQGVTFDPNDLWNPDETLGMNPPKIEEIIRGTSVRDLVDLVGGMPEGTEITFVARDGWETNLGWNNIYDPNPRQGEAVLVWWTERQGYVPAYEDGYRLFYTPEDHVFGQWDMHESMLDKYWHYYSSGGIVYPSCAGISPKWISEIRIYSAYETDWTLNLTGEHSTDISKGFFESALTCTMGANHKAQYTDADGKVWAGMPLYLLCGWVDDSNEHSGKAFNRTLALEGYCIEIIGTNGKIVTLNSRDIIDSRDYLIANTLNGSILDEEGGQWPLVFNGANVSAAMQVDAVKQIRLDLSGTFQDVTNVTAGETAAVPVANASVSMVNITAAQNITQFTVAASVTSLPSEVPQPDATLYQVMQITLFGANEDAIGSAEISFSLPLAWLEASGIAPEDAKLYRWHEGAWQTLPTTYLGSADGYANYTAVTPGFSYFAVGGTPTPGPTPTPSPRSSSSSSSSSSIAAVSGTVGAGGSATFPVSQTAFSSITVNAADQISNLLLTVQAASLPRDVPMPAGQVYEIQQVTLYRADSSAVSGAIISFAVENSWLKTNGLTSADIVLMRYADGAWQSLQTTFVEEKDGKAYFTAKTPGFSYFAIVGESGEAVPAEALAAEATTTPVTTTAPAGTTAAPATTPAQSPVFWALPFAALGVLLLFRRG